MAVGYGWPFYCRRITRGVVTDLEMNGLRPNRSFLLLWVVFFFHGMVPGFWIPALTNILKACGHGTWVAAAFAIPPFCALISPLVGGAMADQRCSANRLFAWTSLAGALALTAAFWTLDARLPPLYFICLLGVYSLLSGPAWGLLATIAMATFDRPEKRFPLVRLGATLGWVAGGLITSYVMKADARPSVGYAAGLAKIVVAGLAFCLPDVPPLGRSNSWKSLLGFDSFLLLKHRDQAVFFMVTLVYLIPLAAFYNYGPELLSDLGDPRPTATMTVAQGTEVASMVLLASLMSRYRVKTLLLTALGLSALRFGMSAYAGSTGLIGWHIGGIALHGVCYTLYFITAQIFLDRRVEPGMRGQAQGLLSMVSGGLGPLLGAIGCGWLRHAVVGENGEGWALFWGLLSGMIVTCFVFFALFYHSREQEAGA